MTPARPNRYIPTLALLLSAAGAIAALAQSQAVPDLSGDWARMTFGLEPPSSGPGPIKNLTRTREGRSDGTQLVGDYNDPILRPTAAAEVRRQGEISKTGNAFQDPANQCAPQGPPWILRQQQIRLMQAKDKVTILYMLDGHVRHIRLNSTHPAKVTPSWTGDSIGRYEGDTLVVDTVGMKVGPVTMSDQFGSPQSEAMHVVERYRVIDYAAAKAAFDANEKDFGRVDTANGNGVYIDFEYRGKGLQLEFTVDDPNVFTAPWGAKVTYLRAGSFFQEQVCAENTREYYDDIDTKIPAAERPDF
jgi:hypothetical protein